MALLVDDIAKAREHLVAEASARGLPVVTFRPGDTPVLDLEMPDLESFVRTAEALQAKAVYVTARWYPSDAGPDLREAIPGLLASLPDAADGRGTEARAIVERALTLYRDHGYPNFLAGFLASGVLHQVHVADRLAWPFVRDMMEREDGEGDEDDVGDDDDEHLCLQDMELDEGAQTILDVLEQMGIDRAQLKREPAKHAAMAIVALEGDVTELKGEPARRLRRIEREAVRRMRKG